jgi:hypothetical protein
MLSKVGDGQWVFASYAWNEDQADAVLAPEDGVPAVAEVAPGKRHSIPSIAECRSCHDSSRTEILGFTALQLSDDRDPNAPHAEPLAGDMITLRTLVAEQRLSPPRPDLAAAPPRIRTDDPKTRAALGYLSTNCGTCHNRESSIASLGLVLKHSLKEHPSCPPALSTTVGKRGHWVVPTAPDASHVITPGRADLSALVARAKSRKPSSQMPPLGTVVADREGVDLLTAWIQAMAAGSCDTVTSH